MLCCAVLCCDVLYYDVLCCSVCELLAYSVLAPQVAVDTEEYDDAAELSEQVDALTDQLGEVRPY